MENTETNRRNQRQSKNSPDCRTCCRLETCENAEEGKFCLQYRSDPPGKRQPDPNDLWNRGEDSPF